MKENPFAILNICSLICEHKKKHGEKQNHSEPEKDCQVCQGHGAPRTDVCSGITV